MILAQVLTPTTHSNCRFLKFAFLVVHIWCALSHTQMFARLFTSAGKSLTKYCTSIANRLEVAHLARTGKFRIKLIENGYRPLQDLLNVIEPHNRGKQNSIPIMTDSLKQCGGEDGDAPGS